MTIIGHGADVNKVVAIAKAHLDLDLSKVTGMKQICIETKVCFMGIFWHATVTAYYEAYDVDLQ